MLGGLLRASSAVFLPAFDCCQHCPTVVAEVRRSPYAAQQWPSDVFAVCAVSRHWHFVVADLESKSAAKRRKPQKVGHIPVPASRGRAPSRPATINLTHVFPRPLATTDNAETRDLVLKTRGVVRRPRTTPLRSRVCGISLLAYDQGFKRTLLTVAGT